MALVASSNGSFALLVTLALYIAYRFTKHRSITHIKGPKSTFLIGPPFPVLAVPAIYKSNIFLCLGNIQNFYYQENVGDLDFQYMKDYGLLWRMSRPLGVSLVSCSSHSVLLTPDRSGTFSSSLIQRQAIPLKARGII